MKRILIVALSATLLAAGCQKTKIINQINPTGEPSLTFTTGMGKLTKVSDVSSDADSVGMANLKAQDFRVWAYGVEDFDRTKEDDREGWDDMLNLPVTFLNGVWGTTKQHFWPGEGLELKFFAVSADEAFMGEKFGPDAASPIVPDAAGSTMEITGFVAENADYDTDLMVADLVQRAQRLGANSVDLTFRHALAKVQFAFNTIETEGINVFVQEVRVEGLKTKGDLAVSYDSKNNNHTVFNWTLDDASAKDVIDDWEDLATTDDGFPTEIEGYSPEEDDYKAMKITSIKDKDPQPNVFTTWLVLPQEVEEKIVYITYLMNERKFEAKFSLAYDALRQTNQPASWKDNQYVRYLVTLAPNLISFTPQVGEWDDVLEVSPEN